VYSLAVGVHVRQYISVQSLKKTKTKKPQKLDKFHDKGKWDNKSYKSTFLIETYFIEEIERKEKKTLKNILVTIYWYVKVSYSV
jgi:hypothetical protein